MRLGLGASGRTPARLLVAAAVSVYTLIYVVLSLSGEYRLSNHGGQDWRNVWCPRHLTRWETPRNFFRSRPRVFLTGMGACYLPLLLIDRTLVHPTDAPFR